MEKYSFFIEFQKQTCNFKTKKEAWVATEDIYKKVNNCNKYKNLNSFNAAYYRFLKTKRI